MVEEERRTGWRSDTGCAVRFFGLRFVLVLFCVAVSVRAVAQAPVGAAHAEGASLFAEKGCAHCHGERAEGGDKGPDLRDVRHRLSAKEMQHQIVNGGQGMPAFGDVLSAAEVHSLIAFLRSLPPGKPAQPTP